MGAAGAGALCGRARRGPEATPGRGGRPRGCRSFGRLGIRARSCGGPPQGACLMGSGSRVAPWDSRRGRALDCARGAAPAGRLARRRAGGGRGAGWRVRVAAVACCEAGGIVAHLQTFHDVVKRTQTTGMPPPPPRSLCPSCQCACAGLCAWACVCARACVGSTYS